MNKPEAQEYIRKIGFTTIADYHLTAVRCLGSGSESLKKNESRGVESNDEIFKRIRKKR